MQGYAGDVFLQIQDALRVAPAQFSEELRSKLGSELDNLRARFAEYQEKNLHLDIARGKPCAEQIELSRPLLDVLDANSTLLDEGVDASNYGNPRGLPRFQKLAAELFDCGPEQVIVGGSSSLALEFFCLSHAFSLGIQGQTPWFRLIAEGKKIRFLCPVPGYDRHFAMSEYFGIESVPIPLYESGPDMDLVKDLVEHDESIKGIWCVPVFQNPSGYTFSDEVVRCFAALTPKAPDFRIYWDNAYAVHDLYPRESEPLSIFRALRELESAEVATSAPKASQASVSGASAAGALASVSPSEQASSSLNPQTPAPSSPSQQTPSSPKPAASEKNIVYAFGSTSKMTFPGSGVSWFAASVADSADLMKSLSVQRVSPDKMNHLAHIRFLPHKQAVIEHMSKHAEILRPKFELVQEVLGEQLGDLRAAGLLEWTSPRGGYFVSFTSPRGCAKKIVALAVKLGLVLTPAGSTWPGMTDPNDNSIRIAPTALPLEQLHDALLIFSLCVRLVCASLAQVR